MLSPQRDSSKRLARAALTIGDDAEFATAAAARAAARSQRAHHTSHFRPLVHALREGLCAHACSDSSEQCEGAAHVRSPVQLLVEIANTWTDDVTDAVSTARAH